MQLFTQLVYENIIFSAFYTLALHSISKYIL